MPIVASTGFAVNRGHGGGVIQAGVCGQIPCVIVQRHVLGVIQWFDSSGSRAATGLEIDRIDVLVMAGEPSIDEETIKRLAQKHILTIAEGPDAPDRGIIIGLYTKNNRVKFAINLKKALESRLVISSRLLKLAKHVIR